MSLRHLLWDTSNEEGLEIPVHTHPGAFPYISTGWLATACTAYVASIILVLLISKSPLLFFILVFWHDERGAAVACPYFLDRYCVA